MPDKPPPLPVAADRLAISNRLSMLFADRSALIKKLVSQSSTTRNPSRRARPLDDDDVLFGTPANQGVGYVSEKPTRDTKREDKMLRGKMLGKRRAGTSGPRSKAEESESDDEQGRGSLGKRKRPRRARARADEPAEAGNGTGDGQDAVAGAENYAATEARESSPQMQDARPKKKKKKKRKRTNKGQE
ncbi:hypothetical protein MANI_009780 [Metarhizium anisopliae]